MIVDQAGPSTNYHAEQREGNGFTETHNRAAYAAKAAERAGILLSKFVPKMVIEEGGTGMSILDLGARGGSAAALFSEHLPQARVVALDLIPEFLDDLDLGIEKVVGDAHDLSQFKDKEFTWTFCSHMLEHCWGPRKVAAEIMRVTEAGIFIVVPLEAEHFTDNCSHYHRSLNPMDWVNVFDTEKWLLMSLTVTNHSDMIMVFFRKDQIVMSGEVPKEHE